ncbi:uncharacterized protein LOC105223881 [Bactrocera dorsalis]|uniref:Uncharacterized protein LOC105223881 n=1 Tax=Bactrocera dorsalis TaxID=27457 RepID=A0A6I9UWC6_BACDO|nr:uncharacterized protein LOC105223881 [Bactrocera dorsalis]
MNEIQQTSQVNTGKTQSLTEDPPKSHKQRVFAWLELIEITNFNANQKDPYMELKHPRAEFFHPSKEPKHMFKKFLAGEEKCIYTIIIEQDDMEAANYFAAEQICVLIKRHTASNERHSVDEDSYDSERDTQAEIDYDVEFEYKIDNKKYNYLAKGYIDILQLFSDECISLQMVVFLYSPKWASGRGAVKTIWNIYTKMPLMKTFHITNLAFISLESLYNLPEELLDMADDMRVDILFQAKFENEDLVFDEFKICTFKVFRKNIIKDQSIYFCWENLRNLNERSPPDVRTGCTNKPQNFLRNLFCTEDREFNFHFINIFHDYALSSNSTVRFVLTDELTEKLEQVIGSDEQCLALKVYNIKQPEEILLQGALEAHIFLYPNVNACRFAVALDDPASHVNFDDAQKRTFATININFYSPITESRSGRSIITKNIDNIAPADEDKYVCNSLLQDNRSLSYKREDAYRKFNQEIKSIAMNILKNNITDYNDSKSYVCCELKILTWKITDLIAYDFNVRVPTETSLEFTNLMTLVYKELTQRVYNILNTFDNKAMTIDQGTIKEDTKLQRRMSYIKLLNEAGDKKLANFLLEKFSQTYADNSTWHFCKFLYDIETLNFDSALEYAKKPVREVYHRAHYYIELAGIYIKYIQFKRNEKNFNEALPYLIEMLNEFSIQFPLELEPWILWHCIYKQCGYLPGIEFTRLKYENLVNQHYWDFPNIPYSRFSIYNDVYVQFYTKKGQLLFIIVKHFLWLGTYIFADIVFDAISDECTPAEKYMFKSTIKILTDDLTEDYTMQSFDYDKSMKFLVAFTNGNIAYYRGEISKALSYYHRILDSKDNENQCLKLGLLRYANFRYNEHKLLDAIKAYEKYLFFGTGAFVAYYGLGKAMYKLNRLPEAEGHFANATNYPLHIPDIWAYLALINLRLGRIENALKLWKYAHVNENCTISKEILTELEALDHKILDLFI